MITFVYNLIVESDRISNNKNNTYRETKTLNKYKIGF